MRMAADEFGAKRCRDVVKAEEGGFFRYARVEHDLQEEVAQFIAKIGCGAPLDGVDDLVSLLDRIGGDRGGRLRQIPRTTRTGCP